MAESKAVRSDVTVFGKTVVLTLSSAGVGSVPITLDPQAAGELAETLARNAFEAYHGRPARTDISYLQARIASKLNDHMRGFLLQRVLTMSNSMFVPIGSWTRERVCQEILDTVLTKVA